MPRSGATSELGFSCLGAERGSEIGVGERDLSNEGASHAIDPLAHT